MLFAEPGARYTALRILTTDQMSRARAKRQTRCESGTQSHGAHQGQPGYRTVLVTQHVRLCAARCSWLRCEDLHHRKLVSSMKIFRTLGTVAVAGTVLALVPVGSAMAADSGDTTATFTLAGGSLDVTAAAGAALTDGAPGAASVSGSLGAVGVSDTRGSTAGWVMSGASSTFVDGAGSVSTGVSYNSGAATGSTGTVTPTSTGATSITAVAPVAAGTLASGNNTASYTPDLTVALPASALAGDYTGTVTTSVA